MTRANSPFQVRERRGGKERNQPRRWTQSMTLLSHYACELPSFGNCDWTCSSQASWGGITRVLQTARWTWCVTDLTRSYQMLIKFLKAQRSYTANVGWSSVWNTKAMHGLLKHNEVILKQPSMYQCKLINMIKSAGFFIQHSRLSCIFLQVM